MLLPTLTTPPTAATLVTKEEAKAHCRVDHADDDNLMNNLIAAAEALLDGYSGILGRALLTQSWQMKTNAFCDRIDLPVGLASLTDTDTTIAYFDAANNTQPLASTVYRVLNDAKGSFIALQANQTWPISYTREDAVTINWKAGYGGAANVPRAIRQAMLMLIGHWYDNREAVVIGATVEKLPLAVEALLAPFRRRTA